MAESNNRGLAGDLLADFQPHVARRVLLQIEREEIPMRQVIGDVKLRWLLRLQVTEPSAVEGRGARRPGRDDQPHALSRLQPAGLLKPSRISNAAGIRRRQGGFVNWQLDPSACETRGRRPQRFEFPGTPQSNDVR